MKKQFYSIVFLFSDMSFGFWEMDRFAMKIDIYKQNLSNNIGSVYPNQINYGEGIDKEVYGGRYKLYNFLYDSHTGYALLGLPSSYPENFNYSNDLISASLAKNQLENSATGGYTTRSVEKLLLKYTIELYIRSYFSRRIIELVQEKEDKCKLLGYKPLGLEKTISPACGIKIINREDKVELKKVRCRSVSLHDALTQYFSQDNSNNAIVNAIEYSNCFSLKKNKAQLKIVDEATRAIREIDSNDPIRERLRNSKILRIYNVLPDEKGKESILFGLAENLASHRKFFWITQLRDELAVLLKS